MRLNQELVDPSEKRAATLRIPNVGDAVDRVVMAAEVEAHEKDPYAAEFFEAMKGDRDVMTMQVHFPAHAVAHPQSYVNRVPVMLLRYGDVSMRDLTELLGDNRLELFPADHLTPEWTSLAQRVAGTIVATQGDPMAALVYAVTGGIKGPIIVLLSNRYKSEAAAFVAAGAADCAAMPVTLNDVDRIVARLSKTATLSRVDGTLGLLLDPVMLTVRLHDQCVRLTQREFAVLQCLSSSQGRVVAAYNLVGYVWGARPSASSRNLLDVYIFQLRKKLERIGLKGAISTVRGVGYALSRTTR